MTFRVNKTVFCNFYLMWLVRRIRCAADVACKNHIIKCDYCNRASSLGYLFNLLVFIGSYIQSRCDPAYSKE